MAGDSSAPTSSPPPESSSTQAVSPGAADVSMSSEKATEGLANDAGDSTSTADKNEVDKPNGKSENERDGKSAGEDTEMNDVANLEESEQKDAKTPAKSTGRTRGTPARVNGTPATNKKTKRKSTGVPEHKTKLNKKKSMPALVERDAQPGDYFFAHMKGYPKWPGIIADEDMLPLSMLKSRPITAKRPDGTYRENYGPGGSKAAERSFAVMFLGSNEFAWMANRDLEPLDVDTIGDSLPTGKTKGLLQAYEIAAEKHDLAHFKDMLDEHLRALAEDEERKEARSKGKGKPKSKVAKAEESETEAPAEEEDVDEMDFDEQEADTNAKSKSKKRKKDAESDDESTKPAKTPKRSKKAAPTPAKLKLTTPKTPNGVTSTKATAKSSTKVKIAKPKGSSSKKPKAKAGNDDDEEMEATSESPKAPEPKPLTMEEQRAKKEKEVLFCRHKLQKGFLTRDQMPKAEEMNAMGELITRLEVFSDLEGSIIRATKIHKVLRAIIKLSSIPRDEEFHFKKRSHDLLAIWNKTLASEPETPTAASGNDKEASATNGIKKDGKAIDEKNEDEAAKAVSDEEKDTEGDAKDDEKKDESMADVGEPTSAADRADEDEDDET